MQPRHLGAAGGDRPQPLQVLRRPCQLERLVEQRDDVGIPAPGAQPPERDEGHEPADPSGARVAQHVVGEATGRVPLAELEPAPRQPRPAVEHRCDELALRGVLSRRLQRRHGDVVPPQLAVPGADLEVPERHDAVVTESSRDVDPAPDPIESGVVARHRQCDAALHARGREHGVVAGLLGERDRLLAVRCGGAEAPVQHRQRAPDLGHDRRCGAVGSPRHEHLGTFQAPLHLLGPSQRDRRTGAAGEQLGGAVDIADRPEPLHRVVERSERVDGAADRVQLVGQPSRRRRRPAGRRDHRRRRHGGRATGSRTGGLTGEPAHLRGVPGGSGTSSSIVRAPRLRRVGSVRG